MQKAATVWPLQSLMMTPMLDDSSRSDEDPSTLILKTPGGGRDQLYKWDGLGVYKSVDAASLNSSIKFFAIYQTWEGEEHLSSWMTLFLLNQIAHAAVRNSSRSWEGLWTKMYMAESWNVHLFLRIIYGTSDKQFQTRLAKSQRSKA